MVKNSGKFETHGELIGVRKDSSELSEEKIILLLKMIAYGLNLNRIGANDSPHMLSLNLKKKKIITKQLNQLKTLKIE